MDLTRTEATEASLSGGRKTKKLKANPNDACKRMRKHRLARRNEMETLRRKVVTLGKKLEKLQTDPNRPLAASPYAMATQVLMKNHDALRKETQEAYRIVRRLHPWVVSQVVATETSQAYIHATLVSEAVTRRYSLAWISERVLNTALAAVHRADIAPWEDDYVHVRVRGSSDDRRSLEAIDVQSKFVVFANMETVVAAYWNMFSTSSPMHTSTVIEAVDDDLMYIAQVYHVSKSKQFYIARRFHYDDRVIITQTAVPMDEKFPMTQDECRASGFGWVVFEPVSDSVTLCRRISHFTAPRSMEGPVSLPEMAGMLYQPQTSPQSMITRCQQVFESVLVDQRNYIRRACELSLLSNAPTTESAAAA
ncbi:hypothetical protein LEN26_011686 [Aphanomyces euteiches]|nr:hypothetical protein LEN26_011686 [Aphanomyces euteiches]KAH9189927.1 hypothetical protein AeNC1_008097 [Aphanomyces euteiches]